MGAVVVIETKLKAHIMKLLSFILPFMALADDSPSGGGRKFSATTDFAWSQISSKTSWSMQDFEKKIQNYGCHCFPANGRIPGGKGAPVDGIDAVCRELARCHSCVAMDHGFQGKVSQEKYKYAVSAGTIDCSSNTDSMKMDQCLCDKHFAETLGNIWDDNLYDLANWTNRRNAQQTIDVQSQCTANGSNSGNLNSCCGTFPTRRPYNDNLFECCSDGSIASVGSC